MSGSKQQYTTIDGFPLDCTISESHDYESELTEFPVESGSVISDNIRNNPLEITINAIVSDTPLGQIAVHSTRALPLMTPSQDRSLNPLLSPKVNDLISPDPDAETTSKPSDALYAKLLKIRDDRKEISIQTSLKRFDNMMLTSLSIPRASTDGESIVFTVKFKQVTIVINERRYNKKSNDGGGQGLGHRNSHGFLNKTVLWRKGTKDGVPFGGAPLEPGYQSEYVEIRTVGLLQFWFHESLADRTMLTSAEYYRFTYDMARDKRDAEHDAVYFQDAWEKRAEFDRAEEAQKHMKNNPFLLQRSVMQNPNASTTVNNAWDQRTDIKTPVSNDFPFGPSGFGGL